MKNIIFDIGSVLIGYRWKDMCLEAGWEEEKAEKIGRGFFDSPLWPDFDAGLVTTQDMIGSVVGKYPDLEFMYCPIIRRSYSLYIRRDYRSGNWLTAA